MGILQSINSIMIYLRSNVAALQHFMVDSLLSVTDRLFVIFTCGAILLIPSLLPYLTIQTFVLLQFMGMGITCIVAFLFLNKKYTIKWQFDLGKTMRIVKQSVPFAILIFLMATYIKVDA